MKGTEVQPLEKNCSYRHCKEKKHQAYACTSVNIIYSTIRSIS